MKHSQTLGIIFCLLLIAACFLPWTVIDGLNLHLTGMDTEGTQFGKPGIVHIFFAIVCIVLFSIQKVWSKRVNVFMAGMNLAWCIRNFLLMSTCSAGDCQTKKIGIYLVLVSSVLMLVMSLLPKIEVAED